MMISPYKHNTNDLESGGMIVFLSLFAHWNDWYAIRNKN
jgi:hypothetical protein